MRVIHEDDGMIELCNGWNYELFGFFRLSRIVRHCLTGNDIILYYEEWSE
jgi:hypothetical protein